MSPLISRKSQKTQKLIESHRNEKIETNNEKKNIKSLLRAELHSLFLVHMIYSPNMFTKVAEEAHINKNSFTLIA